MYEGSNVHFTTNNKPLCSFSGKLCNLRRLNGYAFCVRHILEDPSAPFRQCIYVVKASGLKCTSAIPKAEDREYCNAHMQVMGIIPKKERKRKVEPVIPADGRVPSLPNYKPPNGVNLTDLTKHADHFSASKMFPELAGKLSLDNQKNNGSFHTDTLNKSLNKTSPKSGSSNTLSSKRSRKPTRKSLSILKKKQLGLLTDEEAKACLSRAGCKAYSHYASVRTDESELLTPVIDSSDDESLTTARLVTYNSSLYEPCSPLSSCLSTDLNVDLLNSENCESYSINLQKTCHYLTRTRTLNEELVDYKQRLTSNLIDTAKDNLKSAVLLVQKISKSNTLCSKQKTTGAESHLPTSDNPGLEGRQMCKYKDKDDHPCHKVPLPLANMCLKHIGFNTDQKLFSKCSHPISSAAGVPGEMCTLPAIHLGSCPPLCQRHRPMAIDPFEWDSDSNLRRKRKKPKSFASRRSKKRKKNSKVLKPGNSSTELGASSTSSASDLVKDKSAPSTADSLTSPSLRVDDDADLDSDTENILSDLDKLPLDHDSSKILNEIDNEIDEVLKEEGFNLFSDGEKPGEGLDLTEAEADLLFNSANGEELLDNLKDELPDDITDAILHVEMQAELEKQQQQDQMALPSHPLPPQQPQPVTHHLLSPAVASPATAYHMNGGMDTYTDNEYHTLQQQHSYGHHPGPPPEYPGATKLLHAASQLPPPQHTNHSNLNYMHEQNSRFTHHQIHPKISTSSHNSQMLVRQASSYHMSPTSPLPPSTQINSNHMTMNGMGRLPPVSTITMQPWHAPESTHYHNGYHSTAEHLMFPQNSLPSPPIYHNPRDQRLLYSAQLYNNGAYSISHPHRQPQPQRVNMPLQQ